MRPSPTPPPAYAALLDNLATAVLLLDDTLHVGYMNAACEMLLRVSRNPAQGQQLAAILPGSDALRSRISQATAEHSSFIERDISLNRHNGEPIVVDCSVTPCELDGHCTVVMELHAHENHLHDDSQHTQHQLSLQVVRGLAHEIKNPLGGLRGAAQLLQRELQRPELAEYTGVIIREADRLQKLVDQLLGPNRPPQLQPTNLHVPLEHVRQLVAAELPGNIRILRDYDPSLPMANADFDQLVQVFLNLLGNAVQALAEQASGQIVIRTRAQRRHSIAGNLHALVARIEIEDNGPGIPAELQKLIFYPMVSQRADGHGLGLAIAQTLLHAHGGQIECASQPGKTLFRCYLPLMP